GFLCHSQIRPNSTPWALVGFGSRPMCPRSRAHSPFWRLDTTPRNPSAGRLVEHLARSSMEGASPDAQMSVLLRLRPAEASRQTTGPGAEGSLRLGPSRICKTYSDARGLAS